VKTNPFARWSAVAIAIAASLILSPAAPLLAAPAP
jgi:hypothetical protein